jgi:hypothetical protein
MKDHAQQFGAARTRKEFFINSELRQGHFLGIDFHNTEDHFNVSISFQFQFILAQLISRIAKKSPLMFTIALSVAISRPFSEYNP